MSLTPRDIAFGVTALLAFPLCLDVTAVLSSGEGRSLEDPLFHRGGVQTGPVPTAGR